MRRLIFVAGVGVGYVLGSRAGRERYEQLRTRAQQAWGRDDVQEKVQAATQAVKEQAPAVAEKLGQTTKAATQAVKERVGGSEDLPETLHRGTDGELHADTSGFGPGAGKLP
jgi:hypothetical protein